MILNKNALKWFTKWYTDVENRKTQFITIECYDDLCSMVYGFEALLCGRLNAGSPGLVLGEINSDIAENVFCTQGGKNSGCNTNPTVLQYTRSLNSLVLGQSLTTRLRPVRMPSVMPVLVLNHTA